MPALAVQALNAATERARTAGLLTVVVEDGTLYEVEPDGSRRVVAVVPPPVRVPARVIRVKA